MIFVFIVLYCLRVKTLQSDYQLFRCESKIKLLILLKFFEKFLFYI